MNFDPVRKIADAVLYEGYVLYPYRASARKNQLRWQFGVLAPRSWSRAGGCEHWWRQTECLLECTAAARLAGKLRFLQIARRRVEIADAAGAFHPVARAEIEGTLHTSWEEGVEREVDFALALNPETAADAAVPFEFPAGTEVDAIGGAARIRRVQTALRGMLRIQAEPAAGARRLLKLRVREENLTPWTALDASRDDVVPAFLVGAHMLLGVEKAAFVSLLDPPGWAAEAASGCANVRTWPVMAGAPGDRSLILSSPIILEDYPQVAPESPADLFDAAEIDEILTLRTMTLTEQEKREARATDPRAAALIDRVERMPPEILRRLHGVIRNVHPSREDLANAPWWEAGADPEIDPIEVEGVAVGKGSRVSLRPRLNRADAQDMFLDGRVARVAGVFRDLDGNSYLAVTLEDDPAAELYQWHGRFLYFQPDEIVPMDRS